MTAGAVWETVITGASPARHGRHNSRQLRPGSYNTFRFRPEDLRGEPFWVPLSRAGRRLALIDVPHSAVTEQITGIQVVDWMVHDAASGFATTPPALASELRSRYGEDPVGLCDLLELSTQAEYVGFRDALMEKMAKKVAFARDCAEREPWDLFLTVFGESHCIGHQCWHLHDPNHPRHDRRLAEAIGDPMLTVYEALDAAVAQLLALAGPDTTALVFSSHGMGPLYNGDHLFADVLHRLGHIPPPWAPGVGWRAMRWVWRRFPKAIQGRWSAAQRATIDRLWPRFDPRSTCFPILNGEVFGAIRVNLVGREPDGRIQPGAAYDAFCVTLAQDLCELVNEDTGAPAVRRVLRTADLYRGAHVDALPDLLVEWNCDAPLNTVTSPKIGTMKRPYTGHRTGHHRDQGIFFATGPGLTARRIDGVVSAMDVAPTLAHRLGVTLPDVDGRPILL
jgi:predicted AlkP superfamily phosphohydrolase/phosphomutase